MTNRVVIEVDQFGQQAADQLPWFHIVALQTRLDGPADREWCHASRAAGLVAVGAGTEHQKPLARAAEAAATNFVALAKTVHRSRK